MGLMTSIRELRERLARQRPIAGEGLVSEATSEGTRLHLASRAVSGGSEPYRGPFAGRVSGETSITIGSHRAELDGCRDTVWLGETPFNRDYSGLYFAVPETVTITATAYIYYELQAVEVSTGAHSLRVTLGQSASWPYVRPVSAADPVNVYQGGRWFDVTNRHVVVLGQARVLNGRVTGWRQHQFGHIRVADAARRLLYLEDTGKLRLSFVDYGQSTAMAVVEASVTPGTAAGVWFGHDGNAWRLQIGTGSGLAPGLQVGYVVTGANGRLVYLSELDWIQANLL